MRYPALCTSCGREIPHYYRRCSYCGNPMSDKMIAENIKAFTARLEREAKARMQKMIAQSVSCKHEYKSYETWVYSRTGDYALYRCKSCDKLVR